MPKRKAKARNVSKKSRAPKRSAKRGKKHAKPIAAPVKLSAALDKFLKSSNAKFNTVAHRTVFTAYDTAQTLKQDLKSVAKALVVQSGREQFFAIVPANRNLDLAALKKIANAALVKAGEAKVGSLKLTNERSIKNLAKTPGAVAPFGPLYDLWTFVDNLLLKQKTIVVNAGSFTASLLMTPKEYVRVACGVTGSFSKAKQLPK